MSDQTSKLVEAFRAFVEEQFERSPAVRKLAVELARWVIEHDEHESSGSKTDVRAPDSGEQVAASKPDSAPVSRVPLAIGDCPPIELEVNGTAEQVRDARIASDFSTNQSPATEQPREIDLDLITRRSALKARACRLYIEKRNCPVELQDESAVIKRMHEMLDEAKTIQPCFLWVFWQYEEQPDNAVLEIIASCYEALADAASLCKQVESRFLAPTQSEIEDAFAMFAQASSALRISLADTWLVRKPDQDQLEAHEWLRLKTFDLQIFIERYMKLDDPADPADTPELVASITQLREALEKRKECSKRVDEIINKINFHIRKLPDAGFGEEHDCRKINEGIEQLADLELSPDDYRLETILKTIDRDRFPQQVCPHPWISSLSATILEAKPAKQNGRLWSETVLRVRDALRGTTMAIVGGEPRNEAIERIKTAFDLEDICWVELAEHSSSQPMKAPIFRPEVRVVVALIKLAGHHHVESAKAFAKDAQKPFIAITAGYNPEQIADAIIKQASDQLEISETENA